jgi:hypothetical protein
MKKLISKIITILTLNFILTSCSGKIEIPTFVEDYDQTRRVDVFFTELKPQYQIMNVDISNKESFKLVGIIQKSPHKGLLGRRIDVKKLSYGLRFLGKGQSFFYVPSLSELKKREFIVFIKSINQNDWHIFINSTDLSGVSEINFKTLNDYPKITQQQHSEIKRLIEKENSEQ